MSFHIRPQHLAEVLSTLLLPPIGGNGAEKRRATRIQVEAAVTIWPVINGSPGPAATVLTRDISHSGVGLLQATPAKANDQFILRLPRPKADPILVLCQITHVKILAHSLYAIGAIFSSQLEHSKEPRAATEPGAAPPNAQPSAPDLTAATSATEQASPRHAAVAVPA